MSRIVLFGGSGFIGSHIASSLGASSLGWRQLISPARNSINLLSLEDLRSTLARDDVVINAAGYARATDRSPAGRAMLQASNVEAVKNLAIVGAEAGIAQLIHISSVAAMGRLSGLHRDELSIGPITSPYAESKRQAELTLESFHGMVPITVLRPTSVFGEGRGLAATLCRMACLPVLPLPDGGRALIPFTYVKNVTGAVVSAVGSEATLGGTFIVGDQQSYRLRDIIAGLAQQLDSSPRIVPVPSKLAEAVVRLQGITPIRRGRPLIDGTRLETLTTSISYSIEKFRLATGYVPQYTLADALSRLAAWHMTKPDVPHADA